MEINRTDEVLDFFLLELRRQFGKHLKQIILFGSRAREDWEPDSDYDCVVVLERISAESKNAIDEIAGEILYQYGAVFSIFPVSESAYREQAYNPFLMNVRKEGITL